MECKDGGEGQRDGSKNEGDVKKLNVRQHTKGCTKHTRDGHMQQHIDSQEAKFLDGLSEPLQSL